MKERDVFKASHDKQAEQIEQQGGAPSNPSESAQVTHVPSPHHTHAFFFPVCDTSSNPRITRMLVFSLYVTLLQTLASHACISFPCTLTSLPSALPRGFWCLCGCAGIYCTSRAVCLRVLSLAGQVCGGQWERPALHQWQQRACRQRGEACRREPLSVHFWLVISVHLLMRIAARATPRSVPQGLHSTLWSVRCQDLGIGIVKQCIC